MYISQTCKTHARPRPPSSRQHGGETGLLHFQQVSSGITYCTAGSIAQQGVRALGNTLHVVVAHGDEAAGLATASVRMAPLLLR